MRVYFTLFFLINHTIKTMKTLWLHGMGGIPNQEKMNLLENYGFEVYSLHLDYAKEPNRFEILRDYCLEKNIRFLVGSSYGGFLGFWLSEELAIPCLLLNPAVSLRGKEKTKPNSTKLKSSLCMVALGNQDKEIDYKRTLLFMEKDKREGKEILVKVVEDEGHGFSMEAFEEIIIWSKESLKNQ